MANESSAVGLEWRGARIIVGVLQFVIALLIFSMMAVTFVDVLGRYLFAQPIPGGFEIIEFIMGTLVFSALPIISYDSGHVTVDLFDGVFRGIVRKVKVVFVLAFSALVTGFMGVRLFASAQYFFGTKQLGIQLNIEIAPFILIMALMSFLSCLLIILLIWSYLKTGVEPVASGNMG